MAGYDNQAPGGPEAPAGGNGIRFKGDRVIWTVFFFLCAISIVEVFSSSSNLAFSSGNYLKPVLKHCWLLLVGIVAMVATMNIKCKYFKVVTPLVLAFSIICLIAVICTGETTNGSQRWMTLLGQKFQPSEIAKGALVLATVQILSAMQTPRGADRRAMRYILIVSATIIPLIMLENLSTAVLLGLVVLLLMYVGKVPRAQLGKLLGAIALVLALGAAGIMLVGKSTPEGDAAGKMSLTERVEDRKAGALERLFHRADTWKSRIAHFADHRRVAPEDLDINGKDMQSAHANIAIVSSGLVGKGPGNSDERDFLPQAFSDFIYSIIIEEMGIWGAAFVCLLYIILLFRTASIASRCANTFPALLIMGFALLLVIQAMFNMAVAVGLAPVTGQPLPLISKGGTSTVVNCIYIGIILSVSYSAKRRDEAVDEGPDGNMNGNMDGNADGNMDGNMDGALA